MTKEKNITLLPIDEKKFLETASIINNDSKINKFIKFYNTKDTNGIILNDELIGLFTLNKFIEDNLTIHIALLEQFRTDETYNVVINEIISKYGENYPESEFFMADINYADESSINLFKNLGWNRTYRFDEMMENEGGEFFIIYQKENPGYNINHINRKIVRYATK